MARMTVTKNGEEHLRARIAQLEATLDARERYLDTVTRALSHDLRAPIRAMYGFGEALLEDYGDQLDGVARDFVQRIVDAARQLDTLTSDILSGSTDGAFPRNDEGPNGRR
jgi:signal transduction histidine kinase